jgi:hypothetical protein
MYCSDSSARLIWVSSTTCCHEWLANFHIYRHKHLSVYHIRRGMPSLFLSRSTLVYSTPWDSLVCGPAPQVYFWFFVARGTTRAVLSSDCNRFFGAVAFKTRLVAPSDSLRTSRKICDRLYHRTGVGSSAQGFSLTKLDMTTSAPSAMFNFISITITIHFISFASFHFRVCTCWVWSGRCMIVLLRSFIAVATQIMWYCTESHSGWPPIPRSIANTNRQHELNEVSQPDNSAFISQFHVHSTDTSS